MFIGYRKASRLGREVDGDERRDVGNGKLVARHKRHIGETGIEVGVEIADALPASLGERRDLLVIMRSGDRPAP